MSARVETTTLCLPDTGPYVDGAIRPATGGRTFGHIGPLTGEVAGISADASAGDVEEAIAAARRAFDLTDWATDHTGRPVLVTRLYELFVHNRDRLVAITRHEAGSTMVAVYRAQVDLALICWKDLLALAPLIEWRRIADRRRRMASPPKRSARRSAASARKHCGTSRSPTISRVSRSISKPRRSTDANRRDAAAFYREVR